MATIVVVVEALKLISRGDGESCAWVGAEVEIQRTRRGHAEMHLRALWTVRLVEAWTSALGVGLGLWFGVLACRLRH